MNKWDAVDYDKNSSAQRVWARELIGKLNLRGDERLIDIGCGDGLITTGIAKMLPNGSVVGIDNSSEMIDFATRRLESNPLANLAFLVMDAREINFVDEFDIAFSNATLHWVKDNLPVLRGVEKALKPGGKILFQLGGCGNASGIAGAVIDIMASRKWKSHFVNFEIPYRFYDVTEYEKLLVSAGLKPIRAQLIPKDMTHQGADGLAGWFRTTWFPFIDRIPDEAKDEFVDECIQAYLSNNPLDAEGKSHVKMSRLEIEAEKPAIFPS